MPISCILFDLDDVIRFFDQAARAAIEGSYDLPDGSLMATAIDPDLIESLVTGRLTRAEWSAEVGRRVGSPEAAAEWTVDIGTPDPDALALLDELRAGGYTVAILTNGTDTIDAELATLGIDQHVDAVFNSAVIGVAKPHPDAFRHVCRELDVAPESVFFTDDSASKLGGALEIGMTAVVFTTVGSLRRALRDVGVRISSAS
ncbi:MAG: HAD family hydrolase [Acidimicrobiales bacterium]